MSIHIVVADEASARLYQVEHRHQLQEGLPLRSFGELSDPTAHRHDREFRSDRPGSKSDRAPLRDGRRGATARHGVGGERHARAQQAGRFAHQIVHALESADNGRQIDQIVLIAAPRFLGALRAALPASLRRRVSTEIHRDLLHEAQSVVLEHLQAELAAGRL